MKRLLLILGIIVNIVATARGQYVTSGKIEYERKINVYAKMKDNADDENDPWYQSMKSDVDKFNISYFDLAYCWLLGTALI